MNKIICGDSRQELKNIDSDSIHLIVSDIPYGISYDEWDVIHSNTNSALLGKSPAQEQSSVFSKRGNHSTVGLKRIKKSHWNIINGVYLGHLSVLES